MILLPLRLLPPAKPSEIHYVLDPCWTSPGFRKPSLPKNLRILVLFRVPGFRPSFSLLEPRECFCLMSSCDPVTLHYHGQLARRNRKAHGQVSAAFRIERSGGDDVSAHALESDFGRFRGIAEIYHHARQASIIGFGRPENGITDIGISLHCGA